MISVISIGDLLDVPQSKAKALNMSATGLHAAVTRTIPGASAFMTPRKKVCAMLLLDFSQVRGRRAPI